MRQERLHPGKDVQPPFVTDFTKRFRAAPTSVTVLAAANALPVLGVVGLGWEVFPLVLLYWCENVIVGTINVFKILTSRPREVAGWVGKVFAAPFFVFHYGMFTAIHGVFVFALFGGAAAQALLDSAGIFPSPMLAVRAIRETGIGVAVLALVASHGFSFVRNYLLGGEFHHATINNLMQQPYNRVVVLHVTIIVGGGLLMMLGSPMPGLLLLVLLKTGVDIAAHLKERAKFGSLGSVGS
jgi:hypothetical protein